jgi:hypothetical protein
MRITVKGIGVEVHRHALCKTETGIAGYFEVMIDGEDRMILAAGK